MNRADAVRIRSNHPNICSISMVRNLRLLLGVAAVPNGVVQQSGQWRDQQDDEQQSDASFDGPHRPLRADEPVLSLGPTGAAQHSLNLQGNH